jgi:hypothetical protein
MSCSITARTAVFRTVPADLLTPAPPFPRSAKIELTTRCNLRCYFCASAKRPRAARDMSLPFFERLALRLRRLGVDQLGLFYIGESFLCDWLPEAIQYAKDVCGYPYVFVTTNAVAATPKRVRACMERGLDSLKFAFNWANADQFHAVTGTAAEGFDQAIANVAAARAIRDEIEAASGHRCALYASSVAYDSEQREHMSSTLERLAPMVDEHYWLPLYGDRALGAASSDAPSPSKALPCSTLFTELHVTVDGQLSACCLDAAPRFHMADLDHDTLTHAWHAPEFQALREAHIARDVRGTVCESCIAYKET